MDKENVIYIIYIYKYILYLYIYTHTHKMEYYSAIEREENAAICNNIDGP